MHATDVLSVDPVDPETTLLAAITSGLSVVREPRLVRARERRRPDVITFDLPSAP